MMLIEAMIGILIFTIGILALIGMQALAIRNTVDAKYRTEASLLSNQIIATMWTDVTNLAIYDTTSAIGCPVGGAASTPRERAACRREAWITQVSAALPGAVGPNAPAISVAGSTVTLTIYWVPKAEGVAGDGDPPKPHRYDVITDIRA
jgi:type IV pilus assembly protein PilV